ncbi:host cell division inhibitor Icd-like protein [Serratia fonticola]|uniref:host cell division inhibitor Icd-like protein n=1 Tax=Serratia fonticola TaxID=47917 RepID=UPI001378D25B|nr:host cell division inhibitor Icd-like protein [Serratia fonticola]NCG50242.1 host cell division inhibitor Icd-like protein [Serratia fonticola]
MADIKSIQTRCEFIWRFLSPTNPAAPQGKLIVILVPATTEEEARAVLPGCKLVFSARLPITDGLMEVRHV